MALGINQVFLELHVIVFDFIVSLNKVSLLLIKSYLNLFPLLSQ